MVVNPIMVDNLASPSRKHAYVILTLLNPTFYSKTGVYKGILENIDLLENIDFGYSLESPCQVGSNEYRQPMFRAEI